MFFPKRPKTTWRKFIKIYYYGFINFGERKADQYADSLKEKCQFLSENPLLYRERDDFNPPVRIGYHGKDLIIYTITS